ncbi:metal ABC transporter substrate-binding protein, partial [Enterococcus faecalis]|nr:metal ABC transporter substrate-binding protein [Enterococcus faecalis]
MMRRWKVVVGSLGMLIALFIFGACSTNSKDKDT